MPTRTALLFALLTSGAQAAPFDDLKADLATCLRFETGSAVTPARMPASGRAGIALERCAVELERLDRADPRRTRGDGGLSPSSRAVVGALFGRGDRGGIRGASY